MSVGQHVTAALVALVAASLGVVALNVLYQLLAPRDPRRPPVVFHYVPIIGCAVSYGMDPYKFMFDCREKYGPVFTYPLLGKWITAAVGPLGNDFVLNARHSQVNAEDAYTNLTTPVFGDQVVYDCPNSMLMEQKKFMKVGLTTDNFRKYVPIVASEVTGYLDKHVFAPGASPSIDAINMASEITVCTAAATLQGKEVRAGLNKSFADLYHDLDGGFTPLNFVFPNLPLPSYRRRDAAQVKMRNFYLDIMKQRRERDYDEPPTDILEALQNQSYKNGEPLTDRQIAHMMIALLMAGQHTSAATGGWIILHLAQDQKLQQELYEEQVKQWRNEDGTWRPLEYDSLQTPLVNAVIKETLRLHPPLHSLMRKVTADVEVPKTFASPASEPSLSESERKRNEGVSYVVPRGHFVLAAPGVSHVDPAVWGSDVMEFKPHRWIDGGMGTKEEVADEGEEDYGWGKISKGGKSSYLPFGAGRHRCIGEQFAHVQLGTIISTLIRNYHWTLDNQKFPKQDYTTMIVMPERPRTVSWERR